MTVVLVVTACDLRRVLRRADGMLAHGEEAAQEAHRTLVEARHLLVRTNHATRHVEGVIGKACDMATEVIDGVAFWKGKVQGILSEHLGNGHGTGAGPRRPSRRV